MRVLQPAWAYEGGALPRTQTVRPQTVGVQGVTGKNWVCLGHDIRIAPKQAAAGIGAPRFCAADVAIFHPLALCAVSRETPSNRRVVVESTFRAQPSFPTSNLEGCQNRSPKAIAPSMQLPGLTEPMCRQCPPTQNISAKRWR